MLQAVVTPPRDTGRANITRGRLPQPCIDCGDRHCGGHTQQHAQTELHCRALLLNPISNPFHGTDHRKQSQLEWAQQLPDHRASIKTRPCFKKAPDHTIQPGSMSLAQREWGSALSRIANQRFLPIRCCWCCRQSLQTQPATYAALVPCFRSPRRVAVSAASSAVDQIGRAHV